MNRITSVTRRDIFDAIRNAYIDRSLVGLQGERFCWHGMMSAVDFLGRLYDLKAIPSSDSRYVNAYDDIYHHTITNPNDYPDDWIFSDERFPLKKGSDEELLTFLCEMLHPEVRDERQQDFGNVLWEKVWNDINRLLAPDGYTITFDGQISGRIVFSWIDKTKCNGLEDEVLPFLNLFNRGGYVLDFSTATFDSFTKRIVGVGICSLYGMSKGKSLAQYLQNGKDADVKKLLCALLDYYDNNQEYAMEKSNGSDYNRYYVQCKEIAKCWGKTSAIEQYTVQLEKKFSSEYMSKQISLMISTQKDNPTEAIGKAKEFIESCCKTILEERNIQISKKWNFNQLYDETTKVLHLTPSDVPGTCAEPQILKQILGSLKSVAQGVEALRNSYGSGHGKSSSFKGLEERHAKLAIGSSETVVDFLWTTHVRKKEEGRVN